MREESIWCENPSFFFTLHGSKISSSPLMSSEAATAVTMKPKVAAAGEATVKPRYWQQVQKTSASSAMASSVVERGSSSKASTTHPLGRGNGSTAATHIPAVVATSRWRRSAQVTTSYASASLCFGRRELLQSPSQPLWELRALLSPSRPLRVAQRLFYGISKFGLRPDD